MKKNVVITEPAAVAALKEIYHINGPGKLEWDVSTPGQVTAQGASRLKARDGTLIGLNLNRAKLEGVLKLHGVAALTFLDVRGNKWSGVDFRDLPALTRLRLGDRKLLRQAAEQGLPAAQYDLGLAYYFWESPTCWGRPASVLADVENRYRVDKEHGGGEAWFRYAREYVSDGHGGIKPKLDPCYYLGMNSHEKRIAEAIRWIRLAAEQGYSEAQFCLGNACRLGVGLEEDPEEALKWHLLRSGGGRSPVQLEEDQAEALKWYCLAAEQGHEYAQVRLGGKDMAEPVKRRILEAEQGDSESQVELGNAYRLGHGVREDPAEALKWYRLAAEQGHYHAHVLLGNAYRSGQGVGADQAEAVRFYRLAAELGYPFAQFNLGLAYKFGEGVEKDQAKAAKWFKRAAENGFRPVTEGPYGRNDKYYEE